MAILGPYATEEEAIAACTPDSESDSSSGDVDSGDHQQGSECCSNKSFGDTFHVTVTATSGSCSPCFDGQSWTLTWATIDWRYALDPGLNPCLDPSHVGGTVSFDCSEYAGYWYFQFANGGGSACSFSGSAVPTTCEPFLWTKVCTVYDADCCGGTPATVTITITE